MNAMEPRQAKRDQMPWLGGAVLIVLGALFLLRELTGFELRNWWALFILIPAITSFALAYRSYQEDEGRFTGRVIGAMLGGITPTLIALLFLFNLSWGGFWPVLLIFAGLSMLFAETAKQKPGS